MISWLTRELVGRVVAVLVAAVVLALAGAGLLPQDARLCVGALPAPVALGALPHKPSGLSSRVTVEPAAILPGSPAWSGYHNGPR
jgi:hypothetical protein